MSTIGGRIKTKKIKEVIEMTVLSYIARQREKVIARHAGETYLLGAEEEAVLVTCRSAYDILGEIDAMRGLNLKERSAARKEECFC